MEKATINLFSRLFKDLCHLYIILAHTFSSRFVLLNHRASLYTSQCNKEGSDHTKDGELNLGHAENGLERLEKEGDFGSK